MPYHSGDTICAIGTAPGGAARGMIRVSGPDSIAVVERVFVAADGRVVAEVAAPSIVQGWLCTSSGLGGVPNPPLAPPYKGGEFRVPCDLFLWPNWRSYTREPVAELHTIGSPPILRAALANICAAGARIAEPGEFTLRAFLAGRIDLTQAEAVLGVVDARGNAELDAALIQLAGGLAQPLHTIRGDLLQLLAELEAGLDFVEEDIRFISQRDAVERLTAVRTALAAIAQQLATRNITKELPQVVLTGHPNVGKSSLFNALVRRFGSETANTTRATAIVSPVRGTTRDYLTATVAFGNRPLELLDTAGVDDADIHDNDTIDALAKKAAIERRNRASLRLLCVECLSNETAWDSDSLAPAAACDILVLTKVDHAVGSPSKTPRQIDLGVKSLSQNRRGLSQFCGVRGAKWDGHHPLGDGPLLRDGSGISSKQEDVPVVFTSSITGEGLESLAESVVELLNRDSSLGAAAVATTADRCHESVRLATTAIEAAIKIARESSGDELAATEIRLALDELGKMVGAIYTDDLLDRIFKTFCIGK